VQLARYLTCTSLRTNSTKSSNYYQRFNTHGEYRLNAVSRSSLTVIHIYQSRDSADYITLVDPGHGLSSQTTIPSALRHHPCDQVTPTPRRPRLYQTRCSWPISYSSHHHHHVWFNTFHSHHHCYFISSPFLFTPGLENWWKAYRFFLGGGSFS